MTTQRSRRRSLAMILGGVLLVLLTIIALVATRDAEQQPVALIGDSGSAEQLSLEREGHATLVLTSGDTGWRMIEPCELSVSDTRVDPLIEALAQLSSRYHRDDVDLPGTGLLDPSLIVTLDETRIVIGAVDSTDQRRYAMVGDRIGFVPEWVVSLADGGISALARLELFEKRLVGLGELTESQLPAWQNLTASQVVTWPVPDAPTASMERTLPVVYQDQSSDTLTLIRNPRYAAIRLGNGKCAYILANDDVPDSLDE